MKISADTLVAEALWECQRQHQREVNGVDPGPFSACAHYTRDYYLKAAVALRSALARAEAVK